MRWAKQSEEEAEPTLSVEEAGLGTAASLPWWWFS